MLKGLFKQTFIYGISSSVVKILPFILSPIITRTFSPSEISPFIDFYSVAGIIIVLLTHGMETSFFRFSEKNIKKKQLISTSFFSILFVSVIFISFIFLFQKEISILFNTPKQIDLLLMMSFILCLDSIASIPFAILRKEKKVIKYGTLKVINSISNFSFVLLFLIIIPNIYIGFKPDIKYIFVSNLISSALTLLLLIPTIRIINIKNFNFSIWRSMLSYSIPIMIAGLAGIINESLDRQFLKYLLPSSESFIKMAIYGTIYKLSAFINLFRQSYLLGIEPFFFSHSKKLGSSTLYSKLMTWFIIINCIILLLVISNLNLIADLYIRNSDYYEGLSVAPIILISSVFLGIYLNLSICYKLSDKTKIGAYISIFGAIVTILVNVIFIPLYGYWASAFATLISYFLMMSISYFIGRKIYPIPYEIKKCSFYLISCILFSLCSYYIFSNHSFFTRNSFLILFLLVIFFEQKLYKIKF